MLRWAEACTIFSDKRLLQIFDLHDVLRAFEEEETSAMAMVYIEPNDGGITDEDFVDEDDPGLIDNLSENQLNAMVEAVLMEDVQTTAVKKINPLATKDCRNLVSFLMDCYHLRINFSRI